MHPGDFVITPSWTWHDHGNESGEPMVWLDGLDIPIVRLLDASFAETGEAASQTIARPEGDNAARFANNLLPVDWKPTVKTSPVFNYPYARSRESLDVLSHNEDPDPCHGHKLRYVNPSSGDFAMPTIGTFIQLLPKDFATRPYRSTDATVFVAVEGSGQTRVGDQVFDWEPRDIFVVPSWTGVSHQAVTEAVLFSYSDRPMQEKLGLWREQRGNA
jgi:gentisate 1,2-dioxygenase